MNAERNRGMRRAASPKRQPGRSSERRRKEGLHSVRCVVESSKKTPPPGQSAYLGTPFNVPGIIQAEYYDNGGEGVAYRDRTPGNSGGRLRSDDVDIEACTDATSSISTPMMKV